VVIVGVALVVTACGSSSNMSSVTVASKTTVAKHSGEVDVLSAGSLDTLMTNVVAPAFHKATGLTLIDTSGGSSSLASDIKNHVYSADVFISASPAVDTTLEGGQNGGWVTWYASFASSPEVLAYYPKSKFAIDLKTMPWYEVITKPGFRLGRTDPSQDPGGVLAVKALEETARAQALSPLARLATTTSDEYSEDTEQSGIQSGQLDASFMYEADANSQHSPFVKLTGVNLAGDYTVTIVNGARRPAAETFIKFLLGPIGRAELEADHFGAVSPPTVTGSGVPSSLMILFKR
jgi:molybdate/tungstate transport system substrate-binding protein